jgi:hypothetical protein
VIENDLLPAAVVTVERDGQRVVEHPKDFHGSFPSSLNVEVLGEVVKEILA